MPTKTIQPGICRFDLDENNTHGFMVRIMRRGVAHQEFFSDAQYGNKTKAKKAAIARREELKRELPDPASAYNRRTSRNSSGKVGVHLARDVDARTSGQETYHYVASWRADDGRRVNLKFSWRKHGQKRAWQLAVVARENQVRDRDKVERLLAKRSGRFPPLPKHPDVDGAIGGPQKAVKKKSTAAKKKAATKKKAAGKKKRGATKTAAKKKSAPKKKAAVRKKTAAKKKAVKKQTRATRKR